jgi:CRISPR system Cascade subunit CasB
MMKEEGIQPIIEWWEQIHSDSAKGELAELKRCKTLTEICLTASYQRLRRKATIKDDNRLSIVAGVLARINEQSDQKIGKQMASKKNSEQSVVSEFRFKRLLQAKESEDFFRLMRRAIKLMDGKANLHSVIDFTCYWYKDSEKRKIAGDYYGDQ